MATGQYLFAETPTHDDGLDTTPNVNPRAREETANAYALGASTAAAKLADSRAKHLLQSFESEKKNNADRALQRAREVVFDAHDAPTSLSSLRNSAMELARANSKVYEEAREHFAEREAGARGLPH